jgi:hypothetical protein
MNLYQMISVLACALSALSIACFNRSNKTHSPAISVFAYALTVFYGVAAIQLAINQTPTSPWLSFLMLLHCTYLMFKRGNVSELFNAWAWLIKCQYMNVKRFLKKGTTN